MIDQGNNNTATRLEIKEKENTKNAGTNNVGTEPYMCALIVWHNLMVRSGTERSIRSWRRSEEEKMRREAPCDGARLGNGDAKRQIGSGAGH